MIPSYHYIGDKLAITDDIAALLECNAPVAFGVSGGKDGSAAASAGVRALDALGHTGPRLLIHSDLGRTEWRESIEVCERLAERLGLELVVVRRQAGDMLDRWQTRWANNVQRYASLSCVKLILPWSTASMRFCTSELKTAIICRELVRRFRGQPVVNVTAQRRQESPNRAKAQVSKPNEKLKSGSVQGYDWLPLLDWTLDEVWREHERAGLPIHPAYTVYGTSRVSCVFCILGNRDDLVKATNCLDNLDVYRAQVDLELASTFAFQDRQWLADVAPQLLTPEQAAGLPLAKARAARRQAAEAQIPKHLEYTKGWPTCMPTWPEAVLLSDVRQAVAEAVGLSIDYQTPESILARYEELMAARAAQGHTPVPVLRQEVMSL